MWRCFVATLIALAGCGFSVGAAVDRVDASPRSDAPDDAPLPDGALGPDAAMVDAPINLPNPRIVANAAGSAANATQLMVPVTVPTDARRVLVVAVQLGANCPTDIAPTVVAVTLDNTPLARIAQIVGTPCGSQTTRSEQWLLIAPPSGLHVVRIALSGSMKTIHGGAIVAADLSQAQPVRAVASASGTGKTGSAQVTSIAGDLVISTAGQGRQIVSPASGTMLYLHNNSTSTTLDNSAASSAVAIAPATTTGWTFAQDQADEWQVIATALAPLP